MKLKEVEGGTDLTLTSDISVSSFSKPSWVGGSDPRISELLNDASTSGYRFCEFNNEGYKEYRKSPVASLVTENSGKRKSVNVDFSFNENETLSAVFIKFLVANEFDNVEPSEEQKYSPV
jgi:hypothetical protein